MITTTDGAINFAGQYGTNNYEILTTQTPQYDINQDTINTINNYQTEIVKLMADIEDLRTKFLIVENENYDLRTKLEKMQSEIEHLKIIKAL